MTAGRRAAGVCAVLLVMGGVFVSTAGANNLGAPIPWPNNQYHWFAYAPTAGPDIVNAFENRRVGQFEPTALVTSFHGAGVQDSNNWDVYVEKGYYGQDVWSGIAECRVKTSRNTCSHTHIFVNGSRTDRYDAGSMQMLACHETGHSVGLQHRQFGPNAEYGCMTYDVGYWNTNLRDHNVGHINWIQGELVR